ncbi:MAG TPA: adenylate/guanylate cyclase domain-containing protein [Anaerolineales bacterium]|nr:adenylate/guanylate cyclase domain-containing protein [Anaerolineales bacterium]
MLQEFLSNQMIKFAQKAALPEDTQEEALQKSSLIISSIMFIPAGLLWGLTYLRFGEFRASLIPIGYSLFSLISLIYFTVTRRFNSYRLSQLLLILVCPFLLMVVLGGFFNASAVILWSVLCPFGAILFAEPQRAPRWLGAYLALLVLSGFLQPIVRVQNNLPGSLIISFFVLNIGVVSVTAFVLISYFVKGKNNALALLTLEQEKSERLLLNVLPKEIAPILKEKNGTIADHFESASVLFADIVGFTPLSTEMSPEEMVDLLNEIFSNFDVLVDKYRLEKIRTIGDNYMVACGVPVPRSDHAQALARAALEMMDFVSHHPACLSRGVQFRLGINSGPLVAGVIGRQKFHYDIWGDTVNTASRMESNGLPGKIQITAATYALIQGQFICVRRGKVPIKGKGEMETWFLEGMKEG